MQVLSARITNVNTDTKEAILTAHARSLLFYFGTPMRAAGLWGLSDLQRIENGIYRKAHRLPRDIRSADLYNVTSHADKVSVKIENKAKQLTKGI